MDFNDNPEEAAYRAKARAWLESKAERLEDGDQRGDRLGLVITPQMLVRARAFQAEKAAAGYAGITLPKRYGGAGGTTMQQLIYYQEERHFRVWTAPFAIGLGMCIPTVAQFGTDEHRKRYMAPALSGREIWAQLFSEPAGGSDLAAATTKAVRDGEDWIVTGQKVWTSGAHYSDFGILLARTDPNVAKHRGLTMFIIDLRAPGVTVKPLRQMSGDADFNEIFLDQVRIPDSDRLGEEGDGWKVAMATLMHERLVPAGGLGFVGWREIASLAARCDLNGQPAIVDPRIRERIADSWINDFGRDLLSFRAQTAVSRGEVPGPEQSVLKLLTVNRGQIGAYLAMDLLGESGLLTSETLGEHWEVVEFSWYWGAAMRLAGGSDEVLRNIIAERVLGMPQDHRPDKNVAFNEIPH